MSLVIWSHGSVKLKLFPHRFRKYLRRRENESDEASRPNVLCIEKYLFDHKKIYILSTTPDLKPAVSGEVSTIFLES